MKKYLMAAVITLAAFTMVSCEGSYYVSDRPDQPLYTRPISPGIDYVWIDGDWVWGGGRYNWHEGYWGHPRGGRTWEGGRWNQRNNGWHWNRGHWH